MASQNEGTARVGEILRGMRVRAGLTQSELAHRLEVSQPRVSEIERGIRSPRFDVCHRWAGLCGGRLDLLTAEALEDLRQGRDPIALRVDQIAGKLNEEERMLLNIQVQLAERRIRGDSEPGR